MSAEFVVLAATTDRTTDPYWFAGALLELLGTLFNLLGKHSFRHAALSHKNRGLWYLLGFALWYLAYPACNITALLYASSSIVYAVDGMIVTWNVLLAPYTLGEPVTVSRLTGAALITFGTFGVGGFGAHSEPSPTVDSYLTQFGTPGAIVYFSLLAPVSVMLLAMRQHAKLGSRKHGMWTGILAGWLGGMGIFTKATVSFVTKDATHAVGSPWLYIFAVIAAVCLGTGVTFFAIGLMQHEALFLIPFYEGVIVLQSALSGMLVNRDYTGLPAWRLVLYALSLILVLSGLCLILVWPAGWCRGDAPVPFFNSWLRLQPTHGERSKLKSGKEKEESSAQRDEERCGVCLC